GGVLATAAETLADQLAFDRAIADDLDAAAGDAMAFVRLAHIDQHMPRTGLGRKCVAFACRARQRRGLGIDATICVQVHPVIPGLADFALMAVGRSVVFLVESLRIARIEIPVRPDRPGDRQDRDQPALLPATCAGKKGMAETT